MRKIERFEDTKRLIKIRRKSKKDIQYNRQNLEDTKGVIRIRIWKKNRQHNGQKKKSTKGQTTIYKTYT